VSTPFYLPGDKLVAAFDRLCQLCAGDETIIFDAMAAATSSLRSPFQPPAHNAQTAIKLQEIRNLLRMPSAIGAANIALRLAEQLHQRVAAVGGLPRLSPDDLLEQLYFDTDIAEVRVQLTPATVWAAEWKISLDRRTSGTSRCDIAHHTMGAIVPDYVVGYIHSALRCFTEGFYSAALAILSIGVEATLRDALAVRGYSFQHGASSVDVYAYADCEVSVSGGKYSLEFTSPATAPVKPVADFLAQHGNNPVRARIRRQVHPRIPNRIDLQIQVSALVDYWSSALITQPAAQSIGGLGAALHIARDVEQTMTPSDLPLDFDDVLKAVRNGLIHLSGHALTAPLPTFPAVQGTPYTLGHFVRDSRMVFDFMTAIPRFISSQYLTLRQAGHLFVP
jgi:hypothetical protein